MKTTMAIEVMLLAMALSHDSMAFGGGIVGINYGRLGNNLPPPARVVEFLTKDLNYAIPSVRIFDPEPEVLSALATSNLSVCLGVKNQDLAQMAGSMDYTRNWVRQFVTPYTKGGNGTLKFRYITAGNEIIPGAEAVYVLPAMKNIQQVLEQENVTNVGVSTVLSAAALGSSYPPSNGSFATEVATTLNEISKFVYSKGAPLMINVYPYFALASDPQQVTLDYALFRSTTPVVQDGDRNYFNLFDSIVDSFIAAMVKAVGKEDVKVVVTETGWPSAGSNLPHASVENAKTYNSNLKKHIQTLGGTPRRPNLNLETFIFALFNENQKPEGTEQNFGSFYPNLQEVYPLWR